MPKRHFDPEEDAKISGFIRAEETERRIGISLSKGKGRKTGSFAKSELAVSNRCARFICV